MSRRTSIWLPVPGPISATVPSRRFRIEISPGSPTASATSRARTRSRALVADFAGDRRHGQRAAGVGEVRRSARRILPRDPRRQHDTGLERAGVGAKVEAAEDVVDGAARHHAAAGEQHDRVGEARDLVDGVADVDDRQSRLVAEPLDVGQDLLLQSRVERRQRLVHQQQARVRQQRAADRDPLLLAAGKVGRATVEERADVEKRRDRGERPARLRGGRRSGGRR